MVGIPQSFRAGLCYIRSGPSHTQQIPVCVLPAIQIPVRVLPDVYRLRNDLYCVEWDVKL